MPDEQKMGDGRDHDRESEKPRFTQENDTARQVKLA